MGTTTGNVKTKKMFDNTTRTELASLGEFGLINHLTQHVETTQKTTEKGIGDDAAVLDLSKGKTLISTDLLLEGIHFDLTYVPLKHLGYKAVVVNLSDICAMNGKPTHITVSLGLSNRFSLEAIEELWQGMLLACKKYNVDIIGGDTSSSQKGLVISITSIGTVDPKKVVYRNGAKIGDLVCISGDLGAAYTGLQLLEREKTVFLENPEISPDLEGKDYIVERQLKPEARVDIINELEKLGILPTAMIDVSDGLASEMLHICTQSNVGCKLYEDKFPIDPMTYETARQFNMDPTTCALNGGEDYELLFTVPQTDFDKLKNNADISIIGHITDVSDGCALITRSNNQHPLKAQGWNAFKD